MPKAEKGTPKDIANRIKAKGLQKLKFYCQMCQKQCRDANGFKCHMTSETHLRNMKIFSENAGGIMDHNSQEFERSYLDTLRRRHGVKRVNANNVYQELIQDKHHIHMNATKWPTLSIFVQYLGRTGKCIVEETERGWYISYIERDAAILARAEARKRQVEAEQEAERRWEQQMETQRVETAKVLDLMGGMEPKEATEIQNVLGSTKKIALSLPPTDLKSSSSKAIPKNLKQQNVFDDGNDDDDSHKDEDVAEENIDLNFNPKVTTSTDKKRSISQLDEKMEKSNKKHSHKDIENVRKDYWLRRDILVRIISKTLEGGKYFRRKAIVDRVLEDKYTAEVEVLDSGPEEQDGGDILLLDQNDMETVVPKVGKRVRILNGPGRSKKAVVLSLDPQLQEAELELESGQKLERVQYKDFSKMA
jgi:DNA/RNA-binding protein KIN17